MKYSSLLTHEYDIQNVLELLHIWPLEARATVACKGMPRTWIRFFIILMTLCSAKFALMLILKFFDNLLSLSIGLFLFFAIESPSTQIEMTLQIQNFWLILREIYSICAIYLISSSMVQCYTIRSMRIKFHI